MFRFKRVLATPCETSFSVSSSALHTDLTDAFGRVSTVPAKKRRYKSFHTCDTDTQTRLGQLSEDPIRDDEWTAADFAKPRRLLLFLGDSRESDNSPPDSPISVLSDGCPQRETSRLHTGMPQAEVIAHLQNMLALGDVASRIPAEIVDAFLPFRIAYSTTQSERSLGLYSLGDAESTTISESMSEATSPTAASTPPRSANRVVPQTPWTSKPNIQGYHPAVALFLISGLYEFKTESGHDIRATFAAELTRGPKVDSGTPAILEASHSDLSLAANGDFSRVFLVDLTDVSDIEPQAKFPTQKAILKFANERIYRQKGFSTAVEYHEFSMEMYSWLKSIDFPVVSLLNRNPATILNPETMDGIVVQPLCTRPFLIFPDKPVPDKSNAEILLMPVEDFQNTSMKMIITVLEGIRSTGKVFLPDLQPRNTMAIATSDPSNPFKLVSIDWGEEPSEIQNIIPALSEWMIRPSLSPGQIIPCLKALVRLEEACRSESPGTELKQLSDHLLYHPTYLSWQAALSASSEAEQIRLIQATFDS
ncbi:hypothetical protein EBR96_05385 [bacterium]|nr:hypothetical protein [bacterium]